MYIKICMCCVRKKKHTLMSVREKVYKRVNNPAG